MDNSEELATLETRHRMKTNKAKQKNSTAQKTEKMSNTDLRPNYSVVRKPFLHSIFIFYLSDFFFLFCLCCFSKITGSSFTFVNYRLPVTLLNSNGIDILVTCLFYKYFEHFECAYLYIKMPSRWKCQ